MLFSHFMQCSQVPGGGGGGGGREILAVEGQMPLLCPPSFK